MRTPLALLLLVSACAVDAPRASSPPAGVVRLALAGDFPGLAFPLTVTHAGGKAEIPDGSEHAIRVPADDRELARIDIEGWRPVWVRVPVGGAVRLSTHPCCGITFDSNTYDDALATCAGAAGVCDGDTEEVPHGLAEDAVCGERTRCVPRARLRVVQAAAGGPTAIVDEAGQRYLAGRDPDAPLVPAHRNIADMFSFQVEGASGRQDVAMDAGMAYTIFLDGTEVTRIHATRW